MEANQGLLIIDMQNDYVLPGAPACVAGAMETIPNIVRLLTTFRENNSPVFYAVREYRADGSDIELTRLKGFLEKQKYSVPGTKGCEIVEELTPQPDEYRIVKNRFSSFMNTELDFILRRLGIKSLIIAGTQMPNCIRASVYDAVCYGYEVTLITDASSAKTKEIAEANILDMANIGVSLSSTESFLKKSA